MGCDIHIYIEHYSPSENTWHLLKKIPKSIDNIDRLYVTKDYLEDYFYSDDYNTDCTFDINTCYIPQTELPDGISLRSRCYVRFGMLSEGTRSEFPALFPLRGLPDDLSEFLDNISPDKDGDLHSHNHIYMNEIDYIDPETTVHAYDETSTPASMILKPLYDLAKLLEPIDDLSHFRFVMAFDN